LRESGSGLGSAGHLSGRAFPLSHLGDTPARSHPSPLRSLLHPFAVPHRPQISSTVSGCVSTPTAAECPEPLCPMTLPSGRPRRSPRRALPLRLRSYRLTRQTLSLSGPSSSPVSPESLQVVASPCWDQALPDIISATLAWVLGPVPRRPPRVLAQSFPEDPGLASREPRSADGSIPATQLPQGTHFRGGSHSLRFRLPRSLGPQIAPTATPRGAEPPGRLHHASPGWLPRPGCGIATCPFWAIDMAGLSPAGLQPCRPLLRVMGYGTYRLGVLSRAAPVPHPVVAIQTQGLMEPRPTVDDHQKARNSRAADPDTRDRLPEHMKLR